jgi:hypothetical protein
LVNEREPLAQLPVQHGRAAIGVPVNGMLGVKVRSDRRAPLCQEAAMEDITGQMKVAEVIRRCPETIDVFIARGCPDMRRGFFNLMARVMSVRNAARIHKIPLEPLLEDLNRAAQDAARHQQ